MFQTMILVGFLGRDPEMRYMPSGEPVTSLSLAVSRKYTSNGQTVDETLWFKVSVFGKMAESTNQYLKKGSKVLVEGHLKGDPKTGGPRIWTRQDGTPGASYEVTAATVRFLSSKSENEGSSSSPNEPGSLGAEYEHAGGDNEPPF